MTRATSPSSPLRTGIKLVLALAAGTAVGLAVQTLMRPADTGNPAGALWQRLVSGPAEPVVQRHSISDALQRSLQAQVQAQAQTPPRAAAPAPAPARVDTHLLVGGTVHAARSGPVALHSGTRLQVRLTPNRSGTLELHAINSLGETAGAPLWSAPATAGTAVLSPTLRLQGQRGMETLQVVLRADGGQVLSQNAVQLWHE